MFRHLPPAGNSISFLSVVRTITAAQPAQDPLGGIFRRKLVYLSSGSAAIALCLSSIAGLRERRKVVFPAYTCPSLLAAVLKSGLTPVLCDLEPGGFLMDIESLAEKVDEETLAIMPVHLFGIPERIQAISDLALAKGAYVIEDATQALGNTIESNYLGSFGDFGILSFRRGKPLSLLGGGAVIINNPELARSLDEGFHSLKERDQPSTFPYVLSLMIYSILFNPRLYWIPQGIPWLKLGRTEYVEISTARMNPKVLCIAQSVLPDFEKIRSRRIELTRMYLDILEPHRDKFLFLPERGNELSLLRFPILFKDPGARDKSYFALQRKGLGASRFYPDPVNRIPSVPRSVIWNDGSFPNAECVSRTILTLPLHDRVSADDVTSIASIIIHSTR